MLVDPIIPISNCGLERVLLLPILRCGTNDKDRQIDSSDWRRTLFEKENTETAHNTMRGNQNTTTMARNSIHSRRRRRIMISHTSRPCFRAKPAARIATLGWSLALSFVCLLLPARTLPCASFAILYSFPNSSLWQERYGNNDQHRKQRAPDYYDVLGVAKGAGREDVKNAFRRLVKKFHPGAYGCGRLRQEQSSTGSVCPPCRLRTPLVC